MATSKRVLERQLTELELELMHAVWSHGQCTVREVHDAFPKKLAYTTIATVMKVLEQKGLDYDLLLQMNRTAVTLRAGLLARLA